MEQRKQITGGQRIQRIKKISNIMVLVIWLVLILLCLFYKEQITVERILSITPGNMALAYLLMLVLFALKSVSMVIYGGILYAVSGVVFPLPLAIIVNVLGTVIMVSIPYEIGRKAGNRTLEWIVEKNSNLKNLHSFSGKNGVWVSLFVRIVGMLPADIVGIYLGANKIKFGEYLLGSIVGLLPSVLAFSVMGMSIKDPASPQFLIAAGFQLGLTVFSIVFYLIWRRKISINANDMAEGEEKTRG